MITSSFVIPSIIGLKTHLKSKSWRFLSELAQNLHSEMTNRLHRFEGKIHFKLATFLDPKFKLTYFDAETVQSLKSHIKVVSDTNVDDADGGPGPSKKRKTIFLYAAEPLDEDSAISEFQSYCNLPYYQPGNCSLQFWRDNYERFPKLAKLARRYLSIPASSGPVERIFSSTGKIFRTDRCNLSDKHFSELAFIKCNKNID